MYLSVLSLNTKIKLRLAQIHGFVEDMFPGDAAQTPRIRHLWRLSMDKSTLYVLSKRKPNLHVAKRLSLNTRVYNYDNVLNSLKQDQVWGFSLAANTVKQKRHTKQALTNKQDQLNWLLERQNRFGFKVIDKPNFYTEILSLRHQNCAPSSIQKTEFAGKLQITDLDKFKDAVINGIGREKAYGFGLLMLKKA